MTLAKIDIQSYLYISDGNYCSTCGGKTKRDMYVPYYEMKYKRRGGVVLDLNRTRVFCTHCAELMTETYYHKISSLLISSQN